jgi:hypothetical protein
MEKPSWCLSKRLEPDPDKPSPEQHLADGSGEQRSASELVKRIRKLRWMGTEDEAQRLQIAFRRIKHTDCVLAAPRDTD